MGGSCVVGECAAGTADGHECIGEDIGVSVGLMVGGVVGPSLEVREIAHDEAVIFDVSFMINRSSGMEEDSWKLSLELVLEGV